MRLIFARVLCLLQLLKTLFFYLLSNVLCNCFNLNTPYGKTLPLNKQEQQLQKTVC